jgi:hypothetical protein
VSEETCFRLLYGGNSVGSCRKTRAVLETARDTGHVSTVPVYYVPVYCPTCLGSKGLKRRSYVRVRVRSTVHVYALLNVGSALLSKR